MGTLFEKDADGKPIVDGNGMLVPSTTNVVPDAGIILSTGDPDHFFYNNEDDTTGIFFDFNVTEIDETTTIADTGGDEDLLAAVIAAHDSDELCPSRNAFVPPVPITIFDSCVLEFEFRCRNNDEERTDQVTFNYIFGSEEYYEFVDNVFNDVFGFYLNSENIAVVRNIPRPGTSDPTADKVIVAINSVNQIRNAHLFNGNDPSEDSNNPDDPAIGILYPLIEADGFTNSLEASATTNNVGWNTMKLAVGDTCDADLDTWVLLERNSFACREPTTSPSTAPSLVPSTSIAPTAAPTKSPSVSPTTASPTTSPTASPSSLPSLQPSVVDQIIIIGGSLSISVDVCVFSDADKSAFSAAALLTVKQLVGCADDAELSSDNCVAEIAALCPLTRRLKTSSSYSSSRGLQEEIVQPNDWQLDFTVAATFTCEFASCNSAIDAVSTDSAAGSLVGPIAASFGSDDLLTRLSANMLDTGNFAPDLLLCFAVWGRVDSNPNLEVTPDTGLLSLLPYYPDWEFDSGTCLQGAENAPRYMQLDPESWLYSDLAGCCARYFGGWNENACNNVDGSGLWYVSHAQELCVTDCRVGSGQFCGGLAQDISDDLYSNPRSCCNTDLPWRFIEHCEAFSLQNTCYRGTMKYHRGDNEGWPIKSNVCVRDCDPVRDGASCGGLVEDTYIELWDTAEACCSEHHEWMNPVLCAARSDVQPLDMWWPDKINSLCVHDIVTPTEELSIQVYNSTALCCSEAINWLSVADCRARSGDTTILAATNMYYVDWGRERCVQDCEGDAPCVGLGEAQPWDERYATASECCAMLDWIPRRECFGVGVSVSRNLLGST